MPSLRRSRLPRVNCQVGADKAAADLRAFDMRCALAREATAGGLEMGSGDAQASLQEEGGYVKEQQLFVSPVCSYRMVFVPLPR